MRNSNGVVVARSINFGLFKSLFIALSITLVGCGEPTTETSVSRCFDSTIISLSDDYQALASIDSEEAIYIWASSHSDTDAFNTKPNYRLYQFTETAGGRNLKILADVDGIEVSQGFAESADLLMVDNGVLYFTAYSSEFGVELWFYPLDGSEAPRVLFDLNPGINSSEINWFVKAGDRFFLAAGSLGDTELLQWSGRIGEPPIKLKDLGVQGDFQYANFPVGTDDNLFFAATTAGVGHET